MGVQQHPRTRDSLGTVLITALCEGEGASRFFPPSVALKAAGAPKASSSALPQGSERKATWLQAFLCRKPAL